MTTEMMEGEPHFLKTDSFLERGITRNSEKNKNKEKEALAGAPVAEVPICRMCSEE